MASQTSATRFNSIDICYSNAQPAGLRLGCDAQSVKDDQPLCDVLTFVAVLVCPSFFLTLMSITAMIICELTLKHTIETGITLI